MYIDSYKYIVADTEHEKYKSISGISRDKYMTSQYTKLLKDYIATLDSGYDKVAVLYAGGATIHQAEARQIPERIEESNPHISINYSTAVVKETLSYMMHKWIGMLPCKNNVVYANINGNACASSMHSLYEAEQLLNNKTVDSVIIIAEEKTAFNTIRIFKEHSINITPSDGVVVMKLSNNKSNLEITDTKWAFSYSGSPFYSSKEGYDRITTKGCDYVNPHATGTIQNAEAESEMIGTTECVNLKDKIGHAQGVSGILELCIIADDEGISGSVLCAASGIGNFYGSCVLHK